jgi:hypothetical protein
MALSETERQRSSLRAIRHEIEDLEHRQSQLIRQLSSLDTDLQLKRIAEHNLLRRYRQEAVTNFVRFLR